MPFNKVCARAKRKITLRPLLLVIVSNAFWSGPGAYVSLASLKSGSYICRILIIGTVMTEVQKISTNPGFAV